MSFDIESVHKSAQRVEKFLQKNSKRPSSKAIHDLRTNTRRLETTFTTLGLDSNARVKCLLRDLAGVRKRAGKVRDMDVLTADALTIKHAGEQDCLVQLLEHLGAQRNKFARRLRQMIAKSNPELSRDLNQNAKRLEKFLKEAEAHPADSDAVAAAAAKTITLSNQVTGATRLGRDNLHEYRLKVKELRNVLQLSSEPGDAQFMAKLGEVKDAIGEWHDSEELIAIATDVLRHGSSCGLIKHLRDTSNCRFEHALTLTGDLKRRGRTRPRR